MQNKLLAYVFFCPSKTKCKCLVSCCEGDKRKRKQMTSAVTSNFGKSRFNESEAGNKLRQEQEGDKVVSSRRSSFHLTVGAFRESSVRGPGVRDPPGRDRRDLPAALASHIRQGGARMVSTSAAEAPRGGLISAKAAARTSSAACQFDQTLLGCVFHLGTGSRAWETEATFVPGSHGLTFKVVGAFHTVSQQSVYIQGSLFHVKS